MLAVFRCFGFPEPEPWIIGTYVSTPPFHSHPWKVLRRDDGDCLSKKVILGVDGAPCWPPPPTEDLQDRHPAPLASLSSSSSVHLFFSPFLERRRLFLNLEKPLKYPAQSEAWGEGVAAPHGHTPASLSGRECYCFPHPYPSLTTCSGWALPLSRKRLGLSPCGLSSHILGVWAAYVGRLSYQGPLISNPEKPK